MISSASSKLAVGDPTIAYAAAKAALDAVSRNLAAAWSVQYGITVNSISVGTHPKRNKIPINSEVVVAAAKVGFFLYIRLLFKHLILLLTITCRSDGY